MLIDMKIKQKDNKIVIDNKIQVLMKNIKNIFKKKRNQIVKLQ